MDHTPDRKTTKGRRVRRWEPRPDEVLNTLPDNAIITEAEAAQQLRMTSTALAMRRSRGQSPRYIRLSEHTVRYRIGVVRKFNGIGEQQPSVAA